MAQSAFNPYGGANPGKSGNDPKGRLQNQSAYQQTRFESQQGPLAEAMAGNYGRGSEANYGDYTDIMNQYRGIASGNAGGAGGGGGGGGGFNAQGMYTPFTVAPGKASYNDPFKSYGGYEEFSKTGGYSPEDIANMRARGTSPIRSAYANAERNIGQQRSLQGGYAPNAIAAQAKMAREQGQGMADATQNVEAGLAQARNQGRLAGLGGMSGIETSRLGADVDLSKFNTGLDFQGQTYNADAMARAQAQNIAAGESAAGRGAASAQADQANRLRALQGMTQLYGTTPGMSELFGKQALAATQMGGQFGLDLMDRDYRSQQAPGKFDQTLGRIKNVADVATGIGYPMLDRFGNGDNGGTQGGSPGPWVGPQNQPNYYPQIPTNPNPWAGF